MGAHRHKKGGLDQTMGRLKNAGPGMGESVLLNDAERRRAVGGMNRTMRRGRLGGWGRSIAGHVRRGG